MSVSSKNSSAAVIGALTGGLLSRRTVSTAALSGLLIISQDLVKLRNRGDLGNLQQAVDRVSSCTVKFSAGTVEVWSNGTLPVLSQALLRAVEATDSSYSVKVLERHCFDAEERRQPCPAEQPQVVDEL
eukprot:gene12314-12450_t